MAGASADDLEEIAEGKASARDEAEAGVYSKREAQAKLRHLGGVKVRTHGPKGRGPKRRRRKL